MSNHSLATQPLYKCNCYPRSHQLSHGVNLQPPLVHINFIIVAHDQYKSYHQSRSHCTFDIASRCFTSTKAFKTSSPNISNLPEGRLAPARTYLDVT